MTPLNFTWNDSECYGSPCARGQNCLSECVYKCSGGVPRSVCWPAESRDKATTWERSASVNGKTNNFSRDAAHFHWRHSGPRQGRGVQGSFELHRTVQGGTRGTKEVAQGERAVAKPCVSHRKILLIWSYIAVDTIELGWTSNFLWDTMGRQAIIQLSEHGKEELSQSFTCMVPMYPNLGVFWVLPGGRMLAETRRRWVDPELRLSIFVEPIFETISRKVP